MNIALFAAPGIWAPLQRLVRRFATRTQRPVRRSSLAAPCPLPLRPLRVVRIMEAGQPSGQVGRMVISGRMADVCAELDRLVACEAASH